MTELQTVFQMDSTEVSMMDNETARKYERRLELFGELSNLLNAAPHQTSIQDWQKARKIVKHLFNDAKLD